VPQAEERELGKADTSQVRQAMAVLAAQKREAQEAQRAREKELAAIKVAPADVDVIVAEFEMDKKKAERRLRECKGDLKAALESLLDG
jgi:NACalpha-BTF3-like transcription factor